MKIPDYYLLADQPIGLSAEKSLYISGERYVEDHTSISSYSRGFMMPEECVTDYFKHSNLLGHRKNKTKKPSNIETKPQSKAKQSLIPVHRLW